MSCNLLTHLAWLMWYRMPTCGWWRPVNPKQYEYFLNLAHDICRAVGGFPTPKLIEIALHIPKENRSQATVPFSNRLGSSSASTMSRDVLQPRQSELMNRQLVVASSSHRTSMSIHTVCIWKPSFQRVHKGWKNTAWQAHILDPLFRYRGLEEDPTQMTTVPLLKCRCSSLLSPQPLHLKENHLSLKDRKMSRSLVEVFKNRSPIYLWCG